MVPGFQVLQGFEVKDKLPASLGVFFVQAVQGTPSCGDGLSTLLQGSLP